MTSCMTAGPSWPLWCLRLCGPGLACRLAPGGRLHPGTGEVFLPKLTFKECSGLGLRWLEEPVAQAEWPVPGASLQTGSG